MVVRDFDDQDERSNCIAFDRDDQPPLLIQAKRSLADSVAFQLFESHSFLGVQITLVARRVNDRNRIQKRIDYLRWISLAAAAGCVQQLQLCVGEAKSHERIIAASPFG
jgi:hypothetical protein